MTNHLAMMKGEAIDAFASRLTALGEQQEGEIASALSGSFVDRLRAAMRMLMNEQFNERGAFDKGSLKVVVSLGGRSVIVPIYDDMHPSSQGKAQ